jgi:glycosyltransferase involved in cell wall biosynthesis
VTESLVNTPLSRAVLFLAYYYPPLGGGGVQRSLAFSRMLPEHGYDPVVVTGPGEDIDQWGPIDGSLGTAVPTVRVAGPQPARTTGWRCRAERWLRVEEPFSRWWIEGAVTAARDVGPVDLVYASMSPFETGRAAAQVAAERGVPWVADLRDPWALDDWLVFPTGAHRKLELRTMRRTLASASVIVMNTPDATAALLRRAPELRQKPVATITNGFDPVEFAGPAPERHGDRFRIVHAGHSHTRRERAATRVGRRLLGGAEPGLDTYTRSHAYLLDAVSDLFRRRPELESRVSVELVGALSASERDAMPAWVDPRGYLSHRETIAALRSADLLFLPMHNLARGRRSRIVPGKLYEYLAAGPPILAAVPDGDARDILQAAGNSDLVRPDDVAGLSRAIERRVDEAAEGGRATGAEPAVLARFDRRRLTGDLARAFDAALGPDVADTSVRTRAREVSA